MHQKPSPNPLLLFTVAWGLIEAAGLYAFLTAGGLAGALLALGASLP